MSAASPNRLLWVDGTAGASGDMILGALLDVGVPAARIREALRGLPLPGWTLRSRRIERAGLRGRKVDVRVGRDDPARDWRAVRRIVSGGGLAPAVRDRALAIFRRLFEAEAEVHGSTADRVHLHEAGATDAIVDIVGAAVGLAHLAPWKIVVSPLTTGFGTVRCAHGRYPVPAPATTVLLRGVPARGGEVEAERLTPTGAAILTTIADAWGPLPAMRPRAIGYGAGTLDPGSDPNMLRMILGDADPALEGASGAAPEVAVIECTLDDANPQDLGFAVERLHESGALDVWTAPVAMKKGRPGVLLTALCRRDRLAALAEAILSETSTLGLRWRLEQRIELPRETTTVPTSFGPVRVKVAELPGGGRKAWPEHEDCARLARRHGVPLREVRQAALGSFGRRARPRKPGARKKKKKKTTKKKS